MLSRYFKRHKIFSTISLHFFTLFKTRLKKDLNARWGDENKISMLIDVVF